MERDRRILQAAAAVFHEKGFHGVGMDELGKRAGMNGPALYRHFSSKNEILAALFNEAMDELVGATAQMHEDPRADLDRMIAHHVAFAIGEQHLVNVYQREERSLVDPWRKHFDRRRRAYVERWESTIGRCFPGATATEVSVATQATLGLIFSIAYWPAKLAHGDGVPQLVERIVEQGLAPLATSASR